MSPGVLYATLAYVAWGLFPPYFHQLAGVPALAVQAGHPPWIALILAFSFGGYGLLRWVHWRA